MSETFSKVEVITGVARRRRFTTEQKLAVVAETMQPGMSISYVARRHGLSPSLVFRWRRLMSEGRQGSRSAPTMRSLPAAEVRRLEERVRELERMLGRKTMEVEILKEALDLARAKKPILLSRSAAGTIPGEDGHRDPRRRPLQHRRARQTSTRPKRGPQTVTATSNSLPRSGAWSTRGRPTATGGSPRSSSASGDPPDWPPVNAKRVYRLMKKHGLLLARHTGRRRPASMTARW